MRYEAASGWYLPRAFFAMACLGSVAVTSLAQEPAGLGAVTELGKLNGMALACRETAIAAQARSLMLERAPKTDRYGSAYQQGTQEGFAGITQRGDPCPAGDALTGRFEAIAARIREALPATASAAPAEAR